MKSESTAYSSVHKALNLLEAFIPANEEISALEMSHVVGIHKSTTSRLLATLRDRGYLEQNPTNKKFSLGYKLQELGQSLENSAHSRLVDRARPLMDELRNCVQESIVLGVSSGSGILVQHLSEGTGPLRLKTDIGTTNPYHTGAGGKVLLAFSSPELQEEILNSKLQQRTPNSLSDPVKLKAELAKIVRQGYAIDGEENYLGIRGVAVPVYDRNRKAIAALVVAGSAHNVRAEKIEYFLEKLRNTADKISSIT